MNLALPLRYLPNKTEDDIKSLAPDLHLRYSSKAKRLSLKQETSKGLVTLVIPKGANLKAAYTFVEDNLEWIETHLNKLPPPLYFKDGTEISLFGQRVHLDIFFDESRKTTKIKLYGTYLNVHTNKEDPTSRIIRFIKKESKDAFSKLAIDKAQMIGKSVEKISIKDTSTRWGSCTEDGCISLSWRLAFAPMETIDYVIAHEVAHLEHMNHSKEFWALCESLSSNYTHGKTWLKQNGKELMRYGASL